MHQNVIRGVRSWDSCGPRAYSLFAPNPTSSSFMSAFEGLQVSSVPSQGRLAVWVGFRGSTQDDQRKERGKKDFGEVGRFLFFFPLSRSRSLSGCVHSVKAIGGRFSMSHGDALCFCLSLGRVHKQPGPSSRTIRAQLLLAADEEAIYFKQLTLFRLNFLESVWARKINSFVVRSGIGSISKHLVLLEGIPDPGADPIQVPGARSSGAEAGLMAPPPDTSSAYFSVPP